jgi:N,N'-diacetyllegionaminate synthase
MTRFLIGERLIGAEAACFVIAEAGVNHNGNVQKAFELIDVAAASGADAVKFQTFRPELLASPGAGKAAYQKETTDAGESQLAMLQRLALSFDEFARIKTYCEQKDVLFLSTPFDYQSADFLDQLGMAAFKIPSGELTNLPFLAHIAAKRKPMILSTGMGTLEEVGQAVKTLEKAGAPGFAILHCVSNYPAAAADANLRAMQTLAQFGRPVGYSDHTMGIEVALASVALGATVLEKHFTLDRNMEGPDHRCSLEPGELMALVRGVQMVQSALGSGRKERAAAENDTAMVARRSLFLRNAVAQGAVLRAEDLEALRPGDGISPARFDDIVGRKALHALPARHKLALEDLA